MIISIACTSCSSTLTWQHPFCSSIVCFLQLCHVIRRPAGQVNWRCLYAWMLVSVMLCHLDWLPVVCVSRPVFCGLFWVFIYRTAEGLNRKWGGERGNDMQQRATGWNRTRGAAARTQPLCMLNLLTLLCSKWFIKNIDKFSFTLM